jgi:hypothetical protein
MTSIRSYPNDIATRMGSIWIAASVSNGVMNTRPRSVPRPNVPRKMGQYLTLALGVLFASTIGASQPFSSSTNVFAITQSVLRIFYPEVFGQGRQAIFSSEHPVDSNVWGDFSGTHFTVKRFSSDTSWNPLNDAKTGQLIAPPENTTFLEGQIWVAPRFGLMWLIIEGDLANAKQNTAIAALVESHPEWSDEQAADALKSAGALYGPADKSEFTKSLHLPELEKSLGLKLVSSENPEFPPIRFEGWTNPDHVGSFGRFAWAVRLQADFPGGRPRKYAFVFEPFHGKLTDIFKVP